MRIPYKLTSDERRSNEEHKRVDDHFTAFAISDSMENGGRQSRVFVVWLISTERDPVNLSIADDFPKTAANNLKIEIGNGKAIEIRSVVELIKTLRELLMLFLHCRFVSNVGGFQ
jgi:CRISPR/Cas system CSM-associated protein Csm5 (group 7 of RAMP superfamily)